ncbi:MAG: ribosome maturation factor RimM [Actinomycetes bacterium]
MTDTVEVLVGVVARPHGLRGEVSVELRTDEPTRRFRPGAVLRQEDAPRTVTVAASRQAGGRFLVRFAEVGDRTGAEEMRGVRLVADVEPAEAPTEPGEYYDRQLVGLRVLNAAGVECGRVSGVLHLPTQDLLEVATTAGERLVPFVTALVPEVNPSAGWLKLADVGGLLDDEAE